MSQARTRCAIYTRKSSEEGLDQEYNSLDAQRDACAAYIASQAGEGWTLLPGAYDDGGFSGGNLERPGLTRLLADIAAKKIDVVVVYKVDRLTRSLSDFARIVDTFDQAGASFVSVTQAFNTTTSMGRLTLNMLLSFAQFEREVTSERIRDKIAASKRKGMWMGGNVPLGYDAEGRTLKINEAEAALVRQIFERYLHLGSVRRLRSELNAEGFRSKLVVSTSGRQRGGKPFARGALFHLLSNRVYLGEVPHKGEFHPGLHPPIIDRDLFDAAQLQLAKAAGPEKRKTVGLKPLVPMAPLAGLLFDDAGHRMTPVSAKGRNGGSHRYYVSSALQRGEGAAGSLSRVPAQLLEDFVRRQVQRLHPHPVTWEETRATLRRIDVSEDWLSLQFDGDAPSLIHQAHLRGKVTQDAQTWTLRCDVRLCRRGGRKVVLGPLGESALETHRVDPALFRALIRAEAWKRSLLSGRINTMEAIATAEGLRVAYVQRLIRLAFLSPAIKQAILKGRSAPRFSLQRFMQGDIPLLWSAQT